jgi:hypothetical protein
VRQSVKIKIDGSWPAVFRRDAAVRSSKFSIPRLLVLRQNNRFLREFHEYAAYVGTAARSWNRFNQGLEPDEGSILNNPETLTELLRMPYTLRTVAFSCFLFLYTRALLLKQQHRLTEVQRSISHLTIANFRSRMHYFDDERAKQKILVVSIRVDESPVYGVLKCAWQQLLPRIRRYDFFLQ